VVGQSKEDISDCNGLKDVAMATKFWPKYAKRLTKMAIFNCMRHINAVFFEIGFQLSANLSVTLIQYIRDKVALPWQPI